MTATSRALAPTAALPAAVALALIAAGGCGAGRSERAQPEPTVPTGRPFAWLRPQAPPPGWRLARTPAGATLPYPAGWRLARGDVGTVTAALRDRAGRYVGYLNLTPRQGAERVSNWTAFRPAHDRDEGDRRVRLMAAGARLRFRDGKGACVKDSYATSSGERYVELACLIDGRHPSVVVGAAPPGRWPSQAATIERAIGGVTIAAASR